jgi:hypothetical protein
VIFVLLRMAASAVAPLPPIMLSSRLRNVEWMERMRASVSTGADKNKVHTLWGGWRGALEKGDLRLLEDGSERGGALVSDMVLSETARGARGRWQR